MTTTTRRRFQAHIHHDTYATQAYLYTRTGSPIRLVYKSTTRAGETTLLLAADGSHERSLAYQWLRDVLLPKRPALKHYRNGDNVEVTYTNPR